MFSGFSGTDMSKKQIFMVVSLALLWLVFANATCDINRSQEDLNNSYQLVRFHLNECQEMGASSLDPDTLEKAIRLDAEVEEMLAEGNWRGADEAIAQMEQTVTQLLKRMRNSDSDGDGLSNYAEFMLYGTSWIDRDSDGDGYLDGSEILYHQTDPLDYCGVPKDVPPEMPAQNSCPALEKLRSGS
jgi:hypothetical protein